jgi:hypothetical protein
MAVLRLNALCIGYLSDSEEPAIIILNNESDGDGDNQLTIQIFFSLLLVPVS